MANRFVFSASIIILILGYNSVASAQTADQIERFSKLPPQQQQMLAKQLGIDISSLKQKMQTQSQQPLSLSEPQEFPRGTSFDEYSEPQYHSTENEKEDDELKLFGQELFANEPATFTPQLTGDIPNQYILGPGDELTVQMFGNENAQYLLPIDINGEISIPELGPVSLLGKTYEEAKSLVRQKVGAEKLGVNVSISLTKLRTIRVFISGEAYKPGAYNLNALATVTNAIYAAGGVSDIASLRRIKVNRQGKTVNKLDLYDLLIEGKADNDVLLRHGDVIHIPVAENIVSVEGEVRRPAKYELLSESSLFEMLKLAGDTTPKGYRQSVSVQRYVKGVLHQLTADADDLAFNVKNGDHVLVSPASERVQGAISLLGAVARPGRYQWTSDTSVRKLLGEPEQTLLLEADVNYILVVRQQKLTQHLSFHQLNLASDDDLKLKPNDLVLVFSTQENVSFDDEKIQDFIAAEEDIADAREKFLDAFIESRLRLQKLGVYETEVDNFSDDAIATTEINLSDLEKESILRQRNSYLFSRQNLLTPILKQITYEAGFMQKPRFVDVNGAVKVPGRYPLAEGASISHAIEAAGGLLPQAFAQRSEVTRLFVDDTGKESVSHITFSPKDEVIKGISGTRLQPQDRINIFTIPQWKEELRVTLHGEVIFPGSYTVNRGETLAHVIQRAGGLTDFADENAIIFTRESLKSQERKNLRRLAEELRKEIASQSLRKDAAAGSLVSYTEARKLLRDLTQTDALGRLVLESPQAANSLIVENGDSVFIPKVSQSINVIGEVYVPSSHLFTENVNFDGYIAKSGGYRPLADKGSAYIIRANGAVVLPNQQSGFWFANNSKPITIMPGDTIVVPYDSNNIDTLSLWTNATQIVYQIAVAIAAIGSL